MKVTDKRMFTPDGRLREEFSAVAEAPAEPSGSAELSEPDTEASHTTPPAAGAPVAATAAGPATTAPPPPLELPETPGAFGAPSFFDLVAMLAEPISLYLGDLPLPDGGSAENLELARLHIDLLVVLRQKTAGNLTAQEAGVLEDLLYRLRLRYIQKRG